MTSPSFEFPEIDFAVDPVPNLYELLAEIRTNHRMATIRWFGEPATIFTHYDDVLQGLRDDDVFPAGVSYRRLVEQVQGRTMMTMSGEAHRVHRGLVNAAFARSTSRDLVTSTIRPLADRLVDRFAARGEADLVADFTQHFSFEIIIGILGLPEADIADVHRWVHDIFGSVSDLERAKRAAADLSAFVLPAIAERRSEPRDDLLSDLAAAEVDGRRLSDEEILSFVRLLFPAGADTTFLSTGSLLVGVLSDPASVESLRAKPAAREWAVEEALRWESPVPLLQRWVEHATEWNGVEVPPGQLLWAAGSANRDPERFEAPDEFRIDRRPRGLLSFGQGPHFCLGTHLARAEMRTALDAILERLPGLRLRGEKPPEIVSGLLRGPTSIPVEFDRCD